MKLSIHEIAAKLGINREAMDGILFDIKINNYLLDTCDKPHDFSIVLDRHTKKRIDNPTPAQRMFCKMECSKCGGFADSINVIWYKNGLEDSKNHF